MLDLDMGKYAAFVWPAYGVTVVVLVWMTVAALARSRKFRRLVERREAERDARR